jgi:hypothetical protein
VIDSLEPQTWAEKDLKLNADLLLGRAGISLDRNDKNSKLSYALSEFSATGDKETLKQRMAAINGDVAAEGADDMGVSVGNTTTINQYYSAPAPTQTPTAEAQPAASPPTAEPQAVSDKPTSKPAEVIQDIKAKAPSALKTALIVGSLLGGNALTIGGAAYYLKSVLQQAPQIPQQIDAVVEQFNPNE